MSKFDIMRMIINIIEECGYYDCLGIYHVSDLIIVSMILNNHSISETISVEEIRLCRDPEYKIRMYISNMINKLQGGTEND